MCVCGKCLLNICSAFMYIRSCTMAKVLLSWLILTAFDRRWLRKQSDCYLARSFRDFIENKICPQNTIWVQTCRQYRGPLCRTNCRCLDKPPYCNASRNTAYLYVVDARIAMEILHVVASNSKPCNLCSSLCSPSTVTTLRAEYVFPASFQSSTQIHMY